MKIRETKELQKRRLKEICQENGVNFDSIEALLDSVKTKKLLKRNNYHQEKINEEIEKAVK